jgi:hypothetical protein
LRVPDRGTRLSALIAAVEFPPTSTRSECSTRPSHRSF